MKSHLFLAINGLVLAILITATPVAAAVVYSEDFETSVPGTVSSGPGTYVSVDNAAGNWQVQGGSATNITLTAGADTGGVGGSIALAAMWDQTGGTIYTYNQYTFYGQPGPGAGTPLNTVEVSMDVFAGGMENPAAEQIQFIYQQTAGDAAYRANLVNNAYTHVKFTLNQTDHPEFIDPSTAFNLRVQYGVPDFGFDANNVLRIDNVLVQTITPTVVAGDYNGDQIVNAADYTIWRDTLGSTTDLRANGDTMGASANVIDTADYALWKSKFNNTMGTGSGGLGAGVVPEPACVVLALMAAVAGIAIARRTRRSNHTDFLQSVSH